MFVLRLSMMQCLWVVDVVVSVFAGYRRLPCEPGGPEPLLCIWSVHTINQIWFLNIRATAALDLKSCARSEDNNGPHCSCFAFQPERVIVITG